MQCLRQQRTGIAVFERICNLFRRVKAFAHTAGDKYLRIRCMRFQAIGHQQFARSLRRRRLHHLNDHLRHEAHQAIQLRPIHAHRIHTRTETVSRHDARRFTHSFNATVVKRFNQMPADIQTCGIDHTTVFKHNIVGRTTTDVDVQYTTSMLFRVGVCARALPRDNGFQMRAGGGDDKIAQRFCQFHDGQACVFRFRSFARDDDRTRLNGGYIQTGGLVLPLDKAH